VDRCARSNQLPGFLLPENLDYVGMVKESLTVASWPISDVKPYPGNPRRISDDAVSKVAASIKEYGWRQPIVVDSDGVIIVGHTRLQAAKKLKRRTVPVHVATNLSPAQVKGLRLADNRLHQETYWERDRLVEELTRIEELQFDIAMTGFNEAELRELIGDANFGPDESGNTRLDILATRTVTCPECGHEFETTA
jgi:ParB-like chromosome segregation protein Spo0J